MKPIEKDIFDELIELGFHASRVKETSDKRPDYTFLDKKGQRYWIEQKSKNLSKAEKACFKAQLKRGEVAESVQIIERTNAISGVIRDASRQLKEVAEKEDLRIVWMHAEGIDNTAMTDQIRASLYGLADLVELPDISSEVSEPSLRSFTCFFLTNSDFFLRRASVDGVIISNREGYQLHINPFSSRSGKLRESHLAEVLPTFYIETYEGKPGLMIADTDIDRRDQFKVLEYLKKKYETSYLSVMKTYAYKSQVAP
jgi:hypothetical protein